MKIIGVTGSLGKTTTLWNINYIFRILNIRCCTISTLGNQINLLPETYLLREQGTTFFFNSANHLSKFEMERIFDEIKKYNIKYVFMEVTEKAIQSNVYNDIPFHKVFLTNIMEGLNENTETINNWYNSFESSKKLVREETNVDFSAIKNFNAMTDSCFDSFKNAFSIVESVTNKQVNLNNIYIKKTACPMCLHAQIDGYVYADGSYTFERMKRSYDEIKRRFPDKTVGINIATDGYNGNRFIRNLTQEQISYFDHFKLVPGISHIDIPVLSPANINIVINTKIGRNNFSEDNTLYCSNILGNHISIKNNEYLLN
jgi:hypothetical protein